MAQEKVELEKISIVSDEEPLIRPGYPRILPYGESNGYGYGNPEEEDRLNLHMLWRTIRKRKWLILTIVLIFTTLTTIEMYRTKNTYQATATVEIGKDVTPSTRRGDIIETDDYSDMYMPTVGLKTSILKLRSEPLLEEVAVNLKLDQNPNFLQSTRRSALDAIREILGQGETSMEQAKSAVLPTSTDVVEPVLTRTEEERAKLAPYVDLLAGGLRAEPVKDTRAVTITFAHSDPRIAAAVANGIAQLFLDNNYKTKTEKYTNASEWLERSTRELRARVEQAEQKLTDYTLHNNIFTTDGKETLTTDKLSRLHDQSTRAETDRILKASLYEEVKAGRVAQLPEAFADTNTAEIQKRLNALSIEFAQLDLKFGRDNPKVRDVKEQIVVLQQQLQNGRKGLEEKLHADYERAVRDEQTLKTALERAKAEAVKQNQAAIQLNILKQEVETAKQLYTDFLHKTNQSKVQLAEQQNNLRLIEPAKVPGGPVGPARSRTIFISLLFSLAGGIGLAMFLEHLDNTVKNVEDVNRYAQLPTLSVIPMTSVRPARQLSKKMAGRKAALTNGNSNHGAPGAQPLMALDTRSSVAEAYRVLRTSVLLSTAGNPPKIMLVTSGQPGEGKTTTVVNTAISLAQLGASVLIIDCDLRRPAAHKLLNAPSTQGISTYLSRNIELDSLIQKLKIPNLSFLACGPIPPNPAELVSSDRMKDLLQKLSERYDHILIDSPPLINVTDPVILSTMVDGVILVVHGGKSTRQIVRRARQELTTVGAKIFGVVLNKVDLRREGYDDYYYNRYYSSYGSDEKEASGQ